MILVTGGAGFIGSNFVLDWASQSNTKLDPMKPAPPVTKIILVPFFVCGCEILLMQFVKFKCFFDDIEVVKFSC